ncbi:heat shock 70 kDa protein 12B-like [Mya arenaria]|uniref:heat shock 70 kDa protein 12B-like n=1 Tax=Mya arenaria TaxID=6604 RepID=UPI0022E3FCA6|nr:heat shock 70 kDa protein 12B-like [Mya arenaria]
MSDEASKCDHLLVAAFDFGTTFSGYAFSFRNDPTKIQTNLGWNAGSQKLISLKTPTCVLLNPHKEFVAFGFDAENKYSNLAEDNQHDGWMLFRRFKMLLHNNEGLTRGATVEDINGKSMPAMTIFSMSIRFLRDHLVKTLNTQTVDIEEADIQYVLTIPAIWNDNAKQFMREAAMEAGMEADRIKLALEPEAASIWCQNVTAGLKGELSGMQYMVLDLGGGTADISVHEKMQDGSLKEIHKASGGPWGGTAVDLNYMKWLTNLFGEATMEQFKDQEMADYFDIQREFETKKRNILPDTTGMITFRVAASLKEIHNDIGGKGILTRLSELGLKNKVTYRGDKLRVDASIAKEWFADPVQKTVLHVKVLLAELKMRNVSIILLVGGFGECELVQDAVRKQIINKRLVVPNEAGLAVLKGAVRFGHIPNIVATRVMRYTYGIETSIPFIPAVHPMEYKELVNGEERLNGVFEKFVEVNSDLKIGSIVEKSFQPNDPNKTRISILTSPDQNPFLVHDEGCQRIGNLDIEHPEGEMEDKAFVVYFEFGEIELSVKVKIHKSGREFFKAIDCL